MHLKTPLLLLVLVSLAGLALADVTGGDFDSMPPGPYPGPGQVLEGDPANVQVVQVIDGTSQGAPLPPNASGNMLCIDAVNKSTRIIVEFTFSCIVQPTGVCQVSYDYSVAQWNGTGVEVHVDAAGDYSNPDDIVNLPVGFPPSTTAGGNSELSGDCDGSTHTLAFMVKPGSILYIDNMVTECVAPTPTHRSTWGQLKTRYQ